MSVLGGVDCIGLVAAVAGCCWLLQVAVDPAAVVVGEIHLQAGAAPPPTPPVVAPLPA